MTSAMSRERNDLMAATRRALALAVAAVAIATAASAQTQPPEESRWLIGASAGAYAPFSSLIRSADSHDTRLGPGPAFAVEPQYVISPYAAAYASGVIAFGTVRLGSSIRPAILGPSEQVVLVGGTAGVMLTGDGWLGVNLEPTLRVGGGFKWYGFDLTDAENQVRATADIGVGMRGIGLGVIDVTAEIRYLPSSFDQGRLPTRGIVVQDQRQNDLLFTIGFGIRAR
jgi:opacity protein-like surface antigen